MFCPHSHTEKKLWRAFGSTWGQRAEEIVKILSDRIGWNRNTTYTIIKKCVEKGAIKRIEPKFICSHMVEREDVQRYEIRELVNRMFDGDWERMMAMAEEIHFIE